MYYYFIGKDKIKIKKGKKLLQSNDNQHMVMGDGDTEEKRNRKKFSKVATTANIDHRTSTLFDVQCSMKGKRTK